MKPFPKIVLLCTLLLGALGLTACESLPAPPAPPGGLPAPPPPPKL